MRWWWLAVGSAGCVVGKPSATDTDTAPSDPGDPTGPTGPDTDPTGPDPTTTTTPTPTGDDDDDTTTTTEPASAFADCVGVRADSFGTTTVYEYDADGWLAHWEYDLGSDGSVEDAGDYTFTLDGDVPTESTWSTLSGSTGTTWYDEHGHPTSSTTMTAYGTTTSTWTNTHSGALLTHSRLVTSGSAALVDTDYDGCEWWIAQAIDLYGDGSLVITSDAAWTDRGGCVPAEVVVTTDGASASTTTYDTEGRTLTETYTGGSASWTWTCP